MQLPFRGLITAWLLLASLSQANASVYTFTDLGSFGFDTIELGINSSGQVAGSSLTSGSGGNVSATIWNNATPTALLSLVGNYDSKANAINNAGQVVGSSLTSSYQSHATIWNGTTPTLLAGLGGRESAAFAINNNGMVVGYANTWDDKAHATLWANSSVKNLGTLPGGTKSFATAINDAGQVAGYSEIRLNGMKSNEPLPFHATKWIDGQAFNLGTLGGGKGSFAYAINNAGQVAGYSTMADGSFHATLWNGSTAIGLGTLGGLQSSAYGLNNVGQVVGWALDQDSQLRATLWNGTTATDLNSFLDASTVEAGWYLMEARGINDRGSIVGTAYNFISGSQNAFLLSTVSPVPEPETYLMLLAGLGVVSFIARRKKQASSAGTDALQPSMRKSNGSNEMLFLPA